MTKKIHYPRISLRALSDLAIWVKKFNGARKNQNMGNDTGGSPKMCAEAVDRDSSEFIENLSVEGDKK